MSFDYFAMMPPPPYAAISFAATIFRHQTRLPLSAYAIRRRRRCFSPSAAALLFRQPLTLSASFRRRHAAATLRHAMLIAD
jgi:hypothetical protein